MRYKISILGSTGSIGITTLNIIKKNKKNFHIHLLSTNNNVKKIYQQANEFNVKNVIVTNNKKYLLWRNKFKKKKINIFNNFDCFKKILKKKLDYTIIAISGIEGLYPTIKIIKHTKKIAVANKESIICGWNLIKKELVKNNTKFIPVDSEHFSIFRLINKESKLKINKIIITASGGPFLNKNINNNIKIKDALNHPNWRMGKKITIDSATMMNKVFEVIEAKKIFNIGLNKIDILINPNSYLHAIVIFNDGTIKMLAHETDMEIPIFNSIYDIQNKNYPNLMKFNIKKINNLNLSIPDVNKFKTLKSLKLIPINDTLFETILITINDELVHRFLNKEFKFKKLMFYLNKIINFKFFRKYCNVKPNSVNQILNVQKITKYYVTNYLKKNNV